jgi:hypothetical protein
MSVSRNGLCYMHVIDLVPGGRARARSGGCTRTVAPPVFFSARGWKRVSKKRVRGRVPAFFGPDSARYHTPDKDNVLYLFLGQEPKAAIRVSRANPNQETTEPGCTRRVFSSGLNSSGLGLLLRDAIRTGDDDRGGHAAEEAVLDDANRRLELGRRLGQSVVRCPSVSVRCTL